MNPPFAVVPIAASQRAGSQLELLFTPQSCRDTEAPVRRNLPKEPQPAGGWLTNDRNKCKKKWKKLLFHREDGGVGRLMCVSQPPSPAVYKAPGSVSVCVCRWFCLRLGVCCICAQLLFPEHDHRVEMFQSIRTHRSHKHTITIKTCLKKRHNQT